MEKEERERAAEGRWARGDRGEGLIRARWGNLLYLLSLKEETNGSAGGQRGGQIRVRLRFPTTMPVLVRLDHA